MNGEILQLYNKLKEDFSILKTQFDERWRAHDIASQERAKDYYKKFDELKESLGDILRNLSDVKTLKSRVNTLERLVIAVIILGIAIGLWGRYLMAG